MGTETDDISRMKQIGALIVRADASQAALDKGLAAQAAHAAQITRLIEYAAQVLKKLEAEAEQLGPRAKQAAAGTVRAEVQASLVGAGEAVRDAALNALHPVWATDAQRYDQIHRARLSLVDHIVNSTRRQFTIVTATAIAGVVLIFLSVWVALAWQRSEITRLAQEKADLRGEIATMTAVSQKMQARGLAIDFRKCKDANGGIHRCVAVQPGTPRWGTDKNPLYVLKGY